MSAHVSRFAVDEALERACRLALCLDGLTQDNLFVVGDPDVSNPSMWLIATELLSEAHETDRRGHDRIRFVHAKRRRSCLRREIELGSIASSTVRQKTRKLDPSTAHPAA